MYSSCLLLLCLYQAKMLALVLFVVFVLVIYTSLRVNTTEPTFMVFYVAPNLFCRVYYAFTRRKNEVLARCIVLASVMQPTLPAPTRPRQGCVVRTNTEVLLYSVFKLVRCA